LDTLRFEPPLVGTLVVDFVFVLIFSLGVTSEALRAHVD